MSEIAWKFPLNGDGGEDEGFNHAGINQFKGDVHQILVREVIQNALDASRSTKPVKVKFELKQLKTSSLPDWSGLRKTFSYCAKYWPDHPIEKSFFDNGKKLLKAETIPVMVVSDYETVGVNGEDDDRNGQWHGLVKSTGTSQKGGGEGGSFGLGKNAPFACSDLRTVIYSTINKKKKSVFQGKAVLATHENKPGDKKSKTRCTGYLSDESHSSIRSTKNIPKDFRRNEQGLSLWIIGYNDHSEDWQEEIILSVLNNFWPAIENKKLVVEVGAKKINRDTLKKLLTKHYKPQTCDALEYYLTYRDGKKISSNLKSLGDVSLWLRPTEKLNTTRVAYFRQTGMVIQWAHHRSGIKLAGVFECANDKGNERLRRTEPPTHNAWDANWPEKGESIQVIGEIKDFIRQSIKDMFPVLHKDSLIIEELDNLLGSNDDDLAKDPSKGKETDPDRTKGVKHIELKPKTKTQKARVKTGGGPGDKKGKKRGKGNGKGGKGSGSGVPTELLIEARSFVTNEDSQLYKVLVRTESNRKATLTIRMVGDDGRMQPATIQAATDEHGNLFKIDGSKVKAVKMNGDLKKPVAIKVQLKDFTKRALEVSAYEE